ncbi:FAD-binding oxidoreductase [Gluconacetobacter entanii]|uniref:FAD-binding oxidoreductase n=1 Tax=Gluconacetobacter entanii TaxID=108528 RepID=A0ABT3K1G1_9PROT|nr:FAD-binding oxidoreductase [Gluconacetobacter entanii]MCW4589250.1 FAD-binding oxidoreductase [Gluconacetobacter entanii]MCW4592839.1 FAD-binding oxidoreductase [Gluconacetobacter entanii]NPC88448.1 FAD-binding oxidoreductase [Gluconacetobacter entanii]
MHNDPRSHGLWEVTAPPAPPTTALRGHVDVDVAIIGSGYTGMSAGLHLAQQSRSVAILEANEIGFGGSGRNVGLVNAGLWVMPEDLLTTLGATMGRRVLDLLGNGPREVFDLIAKHDIACEAEPTGTLHCAVGQSGLENLRERERQWQALGAPVRLMDAGEAARHIGSTVYAGALLDERAGTIQPLAYARGLARAAIGAGVQIHTGTCVTGAQQAGEWWHLRTSGGGSVRARWVIVATNAYTTNMWPELRAELVHLPYFNLATRPLPPHVLETILPKKQGAWDTKEILTSFRLDQAGRMIIGSVGALDRAGRRIHHAWGRRALARIYPQLKDEPFETEWYGSIGMTTDAVPRFHRLAPNVVSISGYNGRGISPGTVFGRVLAELVCGTIGIADMPLPLAPVLPVRTRPAREAFYNVGSAIAHAGTAWL